MKSAIAIYLGIGMLVFAYGRYDWHHRTCEWGTPASMAFNFVASEALWPVAIVRGLGSENHNSWRCGDPICGAADNPCRLDLR